MNKKTRELRRLLDIAQSQVPIDSVWDHYKGGTYVVLGTVWDTNTDQVCIRYRRVEGHDYDSVAERSVEFSRPLGEWKEKITEVLDRFIRVE